MKYVLIFILGLIIGSFLNTCIYRIPMGRSVVYPFSRCPACDGRLPWYHMVPMVSFVLLKGRCGLCDGKISKQYPLIELINAGLYIIAFHRQDISILFFKSVLLISLAIVASAIDLKERIIPNGLTGFGLVAGLVFPIVFNNCSAADALSGFAIGGGTLLIIAIISRGNLGGGDIKLMAVVGLFVGWRSTLVALFVSFISGGCFGIFMLITGKKKGKDQVPFGPFISGAAIVALFWGEQLISAYFSIIEILY